MPRLKHQGEHPVNETTPHSPSSNHWSMPGLYKERLTNRELREVLLCWPDPIIRGKLYRWKSKTLGAGVYELWVEEV